MNVFWQDLKYAFRQLRKNPGFTATAILILALGVCASVAIFGFVDGALIKPLPYSDPNRLVYVTESVPMFPRANLSYPDYLDWKRMNTVFSSLDVYNTSGYLLRTPTGTEPVPAVVVSDGFFKTLGITPALGRDFYKGEDLPEAPKTVILSHAAWKKRFASRQGVIGETVSLSGVPYTIVGVLPQNFQFAPGSNSEFWTTLHPTDPCSKRRGCHSLTGIGRLKDGVTVANAFADVKTIARQLEQQYPSDNKGQGADAELLSDVFLSDVRPVLLMLLAGAGLLLLIAYVNVASLLLVRFEGRKREIAVRGALGASRTRLTRQFTTEGMVLVAVSTLLGVVAAQAAMRLLTSLISEDILAGMPYLTGLGLNLHILEFAFAIAVLAVGLFSLTPVIRLRLDDLREGLSEGGRGYAGTLWRRFGANLVVVELAVAVVLLVGAGLLEKSLYKLLHVEVGFQPDHLATLTIALSDVSYGKEAQQVALERQLLDRVSNLPGVESAGITSLLPVSFNGNTTWIRFVGRPYNGEHNEVNQRDVSSALLSTLHARLLRGRYFTDAEDPTKPRVVIINEALAAKYFPGEDPIGKKIGDTDLSASSICEVIGVVENVKDGSLDSEIWPAVYYPFNQSPDTYFALVVRTTQDEASLLPALDKTVREIDPGIGTMNPATMVGRIKNSPSAYVHRSSAWLLGGFATLALILGVVGLYGVIAYSVSRRTREIGVRMALGAQRMSVYRLVMQEAAWLTALGIVFGLLCAIGGATLIRSMLFHVQSWDASTLAAVSVLLAAFALLASYIPARRAARVDPVVALRYE
ncbi:MAG TPA: ABC transporter permease [Candidatus Solibacter sp.]|nr:ABC transporter permease [Candidatus Solibacter sp.]